MQATLRSFALAAFLMCFSHASALQPTTDAPTTSLSGQIELARLVDLASERLRLTVDYDPQSLKGSVALRAPDAIPDADLWPLVNRLLASRGFTSVQLPGDSSFSVVRIEQAASLARVEPADTPGTAGFQTIVVRPTHAAAKDLADAIRPILSKPGGQILELGTTSKDPASASLLISDLAPRLQHVREVISRVDLPASPTPLVEYRPRNLPAQSLSTLAAQIAAKQLAAGSSPLRGELVATPGGDAILVISKSPAAWLDLLAQLDVLEPVTTHTYSINRFGTEDVAGLIEQTIRPGNDDRWRVVSDTLTDSLVVTATPTQHEQVAALLERLASVESVATPMRAFEIRHRPVADLLQSLSTLIDAGVLGDAASDRERVSSGASQRTSPSSTVVTADPPANLLPIAPRPPSRGDLRLTADEATNMLIAIGPPASLARLDELIAMIDVRQPQVMLDVMLVSMTDSDTLSLGVELERLGKIDNAATRLASLFGLSTSGTGGRTTADSAGFTGAVLNPGEFSLIVKALQSLSKGNSLSNPKVLVTNNEQAVFSSTLQQPVQTQTRTGSNDTTFSYGGAESAGTTISVKPQIARGDHLVLTYSIKLSSFVGAATSAGLPPPKQENSVDSVATIPDGHTVVVGGLELISDSNGESRIPGLGAIPLLGNLFKNQSRADTRTRFFVFIRPNVLRHHSFEDLKYLSQYSRDVMNVDDDFPDVQPQIIK